MEQRQREAREKEEEIESKSERGRGRGNEIVKGKRRSAGQNERERREGGRETGCPGPPGQTIAAR